ncbi:hypothetical protein FHR75_001267 [Kineococcus radiotolerans]|uniref:HNH endonuclease n=1 Tax=Kineococcus radiotolerans TaxID=131568 RepID=A0A7W4TKB1_KINRA|nr:HNH endonuclease signature motif containing protein [Kineococcus radiotolerans]MBB2900479.1 hypothetical protein [Kineococcus radiotolerans]
MDAVSETVRVDYRRGVVTPESVWRAIVLYGANSASYKFAFGTTLLETAAAGHTSVSLDQLAPRYAELICQGLKRQPRQGTAASSRFLDACRAYNDGALSHAQLIERTTALGFANVIDAFPKLGGGDAPVRYYDDQRTSPSKGSLTLTDELLALAVTKHATALTAETDARWRLVETAWAAKVPGALLGSIDYEPDTEQLMLTTKVRRRSVTGAVAALNGYQDGRCAYCNRTMGADGIGGPIVEHVLPFMLKGSWTGPDVDAIWNLVLSCFPCNSAKAGRAPDERWMPWLERRNNDLISSHHPLREILIAQTGATPPARHLMLRDTYRHATETLPAIWTTPVPRP